MSLIVRTLAVLLALYAPQSCWGATKVFDMKRLDTNVSIGTITFDDKGTTTGLTVTPALTANPILDNASGSGHGFHVHTNANCGMDGTTVGGAAGGHLVGTGTRHGDPTASDSHLGDMPRLVPGADGSATTAVEAPRLSLADLTNRAIIIHAMGDDYSDNNLGGGGARVACALEMTGLSTKVSVGSLIMALLVMSIV